MLLTCQIVGIVRLGGAFLLQDVGTIIPDCVSDGLVRPEASRCGRSEKPMPWPEIERTGS